VLVILGRKQPLNVLGSFSQLVGIRDLFRRFGTRRPEEVASVRRMISGGHRSQLCSV
jgi:hypothetical protein